MHTHEGCFADKVVQSVFCVAPHKQNGAASLANALRRTLINQVPCYAAVKIVEHKYEADMVLDVLAHTLALVPITFKGAGDMLDVLQTFSATNQGTVMFKLCVACSSLDDCDPGMLFREVTTADMQWCPTDFDKDFPTDLQPHVTFSTIPLLHLKPGQAVHLDIICAPGIGEQHSKWSVVCPAFLRYPKQVEVLSPNNIDDKDQEDQEAAVRQDALTNPSNSTMELCVETTSAVSPLDAVETSCKILRNQLHDLQASLSAFS